MNRRDFLKMAALGGAAWLLDPRGIWAYDLSPRGLKKFIQPLPGLGPTGIPVASPDTLAVPGVDSYTIQLAAYRHQFHPDLPDSSVLGYADVTGGATPNHRYLGGVIVARRGRPVKVTFRNLLPATHPLPVDRTIPGAEEGPDNRAAIHLHGGFTTWESDGTPFAWFAPDGTHGESFANPGPNPGQADHYYPNDQSARLLWYHDHAMGLTRINAYAGLASAYVLRDDFEDGRVVGGYIPSREIPLIIQEKTFVDGLDPDYTWGKQGDLWYPYRYDHVRPTDRWDYGPEVDPPAEASEPLPAVSAIPEFFGDTVVINGAAWPYLEVEQRHYRFRILNGSQARFYNLQLYYARNANSAEANLSAPGPRLIQIGTEGGFLPEPVVLNDPPRRMKFDADPSSPTFGNAVSYNLLLAPGERADVVIDFSRVAAGSRLVLYSDSPAPFPGGDQRNDFFTGAPDRSRRGGSPPIEPGRGPNTRTLLQLRITPRTGPKDPPSMDLLESRAVNRSGPNPLAGGNPFLPITRADAVRVRNLTLNEDFDEYGRLIQRLGTDQPNGENNQGLRTFARPYMDPSTENPAAGDIEVWRIFNLTMDTHPIHFHLANVRLLSRRPFNAARYKGIARYAGPGRGPDPNERSWKETIRMNPGECTSVLVKWDLPAVPYPVPVSPRTGGHEYVWHCHILEHEEHDMMRPMVVTA
jgi:spore coat protein A